MKLLILLSVLTIFFRLNTANAQNCDTNALIIDPVRASDTDPGIAFELAQHYTFFNPDCTPKNILLVHLVGTFGDPYQTLYFPKLAANNGFHVLSVKYPNDLSAQTACSSSNDPDCHFKFRKEIIEGVDYSPEIAVDSVNSISNRLIRLLQFMDANTTSQNWGQFFTGDSIHWDRVMISGHSQGGGHAAVMAIDRPLHRVLMFASPNDYSNTFGQTATWTNLPHATADSAYYSFNNTNDLVAQYNWQFSAAVNFGMASFGDTVNVEQNDCPYGNTHNLFTDRDSTGFTENHGMVVNDVNVPLGPNGRPVFEDVWRYMLGLPCTILSLDEVQETNCIIYPNPGKNSIAIESHENIQSVVMRDLTGKHLLTVRPANSVATVDVSALHTGVYWVEITLISGKRATLRWLKD